MSDAIPTEMELLRKALFIPCETQNELHEWIECYLGLDIPDVQVDADSTTSPMGAIWEVYDAFRCRKLRLPDAQKYEQIKELMDYSCRDGFKTLGASILECIVLLHFSLSVAHMAAIEKQAKKAQTYVKDTFEKPLLRDYVTTKNETRMEITRYTHRSTGEVITLGQFNDLSTEAEREQYDRQWNYIVIIICTMAGANSEHVPFMVVDEVDVVSNVRAYEEAKLIPSAWKGVSPITLYISTRKFAFGLVQRELDDAVTTAEKEGTGLQNRHWNILDVTERCPPERHLPNEPKINIYRMDPEGQLKGRAISEEAWNDLQDDKKQMYFRDTGFAGCLKNCKIFFACKGALATKQTSNSPLLKKIDDVIGQFRKLSPGMANAQLLCRKPSEEGLIFPHLERDVHLITAAQMAEKITGEPYPHTFNKKQLIHLMKERGLEFAAGMDHGHSHNFAVTSGAKDGNRLFIFDQQAAPELEVDHKVLLLENTIKAWDPRIYGDTADPSSNKYIKRHGFRILEWKKERDSVVGGIEIMRAKLYPSIGEPQLFFLAGDEGVELLFRRLSKYHWKLDDAGRPTNVPDDTDDDECDSCRYLVMNEFAPRGRIIAIKESSHSNAPAAPQAPSQTNYLTHFINQAVGGVPIGTDDGSMTDSGVVMSGTKGRSGKFQWDL